MRTAIKSGLLALAATLAMGATVAHAGSRDAETSMKAEDPLAMAELEVARAEKADPGAVKVPAFWGQLKSCAVSNLPKKEADGFRAVFAPTIVSSGTSRTAGVGVIGYF